MEYWVMEGMEGNQGGETKELSLRIKAQGGN